MTQRPVKSTVPITKWEFPILERAGRQKIFQFGESPFLNSIRAKLGINTCIICYYFFCMPHSHKEIEAASKHVLPSEIIFVTESSAY